MYKSNQQNKLYITGACVLTLQLFKCSVFKVKLKFKTYAISTYKSSESAGTV